jgi:hypothetical protein
VGRLSTVGVFLLRYAARLYLWPEAYALLRRPITRRTIPGESAHDLDRTDVPTMEGTFLETMPPVADMEPALCVAMTGELRSGDGLINRTGDSASGSPVPADGGPVDAAHGPAYDQVRACQVM